MNYIDDQLPASFLLGNRLALGNPSDIMTTKAGSDQAEIFKKYKSKEYTIREIYILLNIDEYIHVAHLYMSHDDILKIDIHMHCNTLCTIYYLYHMTLHCSMLSTDMYAYGLYTIVFKYTIIRDILVHVHMLKINYPPQYYYGFKTTYYYS